MEGWRVGGTSTPNLFFLFFPPTLLYFISRNTLQPSTSPPIFHSVSSLTYFITETVTKTQPHEQPSQVEGSWKGGCKPVHLMGRAIDEVASGRMDTLTLQNKCGEMMRWWVHPITIYVWYIRSNIRKRPICPSVRLEEKGLLSVSWRVDGWTL